MWVWMRSKSLESRVGSRAGVISVFASLNHDLSSFLAYLASFNALSPAAAQTTVTWCPREVRPFERWWTYSSTPPVVPILTGVWMIFIDILPGAPIQPPGFMDICISF